MNDATDREFPECAVAVLVSRVDGEWLSGALLCSCLVGRVYVERMYETDALLARLLERHDNLAALANDWVER